jgi:hypothetical protein
MWKSAGRAPSLRVFTLAFALQLRKKHRKTAVRVRQTSVRLIKTSGRVQYTRTYYQALTHYKTATNTHITKPTHTHITKQYKTTTVQIKTNTVQDLPKLNTTIHIR